VEGNELKSHTTINYPIGWKVNPQAKYQTINKFFIVIVPQNTTGQENP